MDNVNNECATETTTKDELVAAAVIVAVVAGSYYVVRRGVHKMVASEIRKQIRRSKKEK